MPIHIKADKSDLADKVLLPGNPERAEYIAKEFLDDVNLYTEYRDMLGYTGYYEGKRVSVQTTGMGIPSTSIVLEELEELGVSEFIRIGTCGALSNDLELSDLVIAQSASTIGSTINKIDDDTILSPVSDFNLTKKIFETAKTYSIPNHVGQVVTSDYFYGLSDYVIKNLSDYGVLAAEMETAGIFNIASKYGLKAASVLTVSDIYFKDKRADKDTILKGVDDMTKVVLDTIAKESTTPPHRDGAW